ncbi:hypothetical protein [Wenzhouxiangella sp. XN24]|uniref:hypothetical protein n=1 Tax=Wenzhouxiangella sp. XN24 TaxID=2713569 RepID=UPI0013EE1605|nr:hypothetical protein [Wenzhouxiangella sp. XN24]NGX16099.1 hypothetical protein [Wenzhouxiangella sp. XN24]
MRPLCIAPVVALLLAHAGWAATAACNPDPPQPPVLRGYDYDEVAAAQLLRDAKSVVAARLELRVDVELPSPDDAPGDAVRDAPLSATYVFEALEGWQAPTPRRISLSGYWVPCDIEPEAGRVFLLYLEGERLLHAVPVEALDFELAMLGEPDWFYDARGRFVPDPGQ